MTARRTYAERLPTRGQRVQRVQFDSFGGGSRWGTVVKLVSRSTSRVKWDDGTESVEANAYLQEVL